MPVQGEDGDTGATLATLDAIAARLRGLAAPLRFGAAASPAERVAAYRLRYQVAIERGWARPEDLPAGEERDADDERAVQVVGWDGERLVATARLVLPVPGRPLPTEAAFDLVIEPRGRVVDWGRVTVVRSHSGPGHRALAGLLGQSWHELRARGYSEVCAVLAPAVVRLYGQLGVRFTLLGPPRSDRTGSRAPARFDTTASALALAAWLRRLVGPGEPDAESGTEAPSFR